jgi:hypothetical protein
MGTEYYVSSFKFRELESLRDILFKMATGRPSKWSTIDTNGDVEQADGERDERKARHKARTVRCSRFDGALRLRDGSEVLHAVQY